MSETHRDIDQIIVRELTGRTSPKEEKQLKDWILEADEHYMTYKLLQQTGKPGLHENPLLITDDSFEKIWQESSKQEKTTIGQYGLRILKASSVIAASILLIFASVFTYRQVTIPKEVTEKVSEPYVIEKFSPSGQKIKIFLPDGSSLWLNAGSKIQYTSDFNEKYRTVWLTGEAYFDIYDDPGKPFQVKSGNVSIKALGTSFNVNTFYGNREVEIVVEEGKVTIENLFSSLVPGMPLKAILQPGEKALYSLNKAEFEIDSLPDTYEYTCWKNGVLSFQNADFETVINKLEKWYGVNFILDEVPDQAWTFNGEFKDEYLDKVLESLLFEEGIRYHKSNNTIQIDFENQE